MEIIENKLHRILRNADDEQLIEVVKAANFDNIDILDSDADTFDETKIPIKHDHGRYLLLNNDEVVVQKDRVKDLLSFKDWQKIFKKLTDKSLIETLKTFEN